MLASCFERQRGMGTARVGDIRNECEVITADIMQLPADQITSQGGPENIANWDSVHHLDLGSSRSSDCSLNPKKSIR